jgi:hypothetical protein
MWLRSIGKRSNKTVLPLWAVKALQDLGYGERNYTKVFNRDPDVWMRNQEKNVPER